MRFIVEFTTDRPTTGSSTIADLVIGAGRIPGDGEQQSVQDRAPLPRSPERGVVR